MKSTWAQSEGDPSPGKEEAQSRRTVDLHRKSNNYCFFPVLHLGNLGDFLKNYLSILVTSGAPTKGFVPGLQQWARAREGPWEVARRRGRRKVTTPIL